MNDEMALKMIAENEWTILVVNSSGDICDLIPTDSMPTFEMLKKIGDVNKGKAAKCLQKSIITESQLLKEVDSLVEALKWAKTHKFKPGANSPEKEK